ncbi:3-methylcrotonoyl-CoA carboxylase alpha subunit [Panacagrimonas perspica]|uniref:Biotin carboxylase n=1 Tax=Panacagrimonas perspica TaxID=381431 RepID=A0A4S3K4C2_9GAMM|nr:acetyl/propionyl/methylcrotonyl-CoA carboxylase subunit alpha [Panacagrimonas perspica]TDU25788.1 3-methylcrotonoyl-CoA carboxylase alpha subunit [Panacagrimonas perspica]THD02909.1 3-methylcrotonyl-CoA carboxylase [Panacagrimonas perspica]
MFTKILIANRGEIACRVINTCRKLGIRTVAVYSEADAGARHVRMADEAWCVGPAPSRESYLRSDKILEVAMASGAQAVHPGYGFLSENEGFANACAEAGIVFIGPPVEAIRAMGSKSAAKALMEQAKVPLVPGYHGDNQDPAFLNQQADRIGYPVLIKASAGGGGKGMRVVEKSADFAAGLASCQREARSSFGDDKVLVEKYLQRPRHIEIQVFGDSQGNVISLHERDCSAQRRHQKVVEEAPAPGMTPERRAAMGKAACDAARAVGYVGAGTVEFIADQDGTFFFMEMNTRLQVEHPVTEMITGLDLVEWQLRVAGGAPLPLQQDQVPLRGHSIEVRVYAEEPEKGFLPSIGTLAHFAPPAASANVRIDTGVEQGDVVSPHYDPMLAKLIVWDETRERACDRMLKALSEFRVVGVGNNVEFLGRLVGCDSFRSGQVDTGLIERERATLIPEAQPVAAEVFALAAFASVEAERATRSAFTVEPHSPWSVADGWRLNGALTRTLAFKSGEQQVETVIEQGSRGSLRIDSRPAVGSTRPDGTVRLAWGDAKLDAHVVAQGETLYVFSGGRRHAIQKIDPLLHAGEDQEEGGGLVAPMSGKIIALIANPGADIEKGAPLLVMEAMKMEHTIVAPANGTLKAFRFAIGDQVPEGAELVEFEKAPA